MKWKNIALLVGALSNKMVNILTHDFWSYLSLACSVHLITTELCSKQVFWATVYIKKQQQIPSGQVSLEHSKSNSVTSHFEFFWSIWSSCIKGDIWSRLWDPHAERAHMQSLSFSAASGVSAFFSEILRWLCSLRDLWPYCKSKDWRWELPHFLPTTVRRSASWHCRPRKWSLLGSHLLPIYLSQVLSCLFLGLCVHSYKLSLHVRYAQLHDPQV